MSELKLLNKNDLSLVLSSNDIKEVEKYMSLYLNKAIEEPNRVKGAIRRVNNLKLMLEKAEHDLEKQLLSEQIEYAEKATNSFEDYYKITYKRLASRRAELMGEDE